VAKARPKSKPKKPPGQSEADELRTRIAKLLAIDQAEVELRALRALANSLGLVEQQPKGANPLPQGL
jgi:hypothetical protein